jgi:Bacterial Ig-like domain (group 3)
MIESAPLPHPAPCLFLLQSSRFAVYLGDAANQRSTSAVLNQIVRQTTSAAQIASLLNPSTHGQPVTFIATISSPTVTPTGPVTFTAGKTVLGTAQLSGGRARFTTSALAAGSTVITATYFGNSNVAESSASLTQVVH